MLPAVTKCMAPGEIFFPGDGSDAAGSRWPGNEEEGNTKITKEDQGHQDDVLARAAVIDFSLRHRRQADQPRRHEEHEGFHEEERFSNRSGSSRNLLLCDCFVFLVSSWLIILPAAPRKLDLAPGTDVPGT